MKANRTITRENAMRVLYQIFLYKKNKSAKKIRKSKLFVAGFEANKNRRNYDEYFIFDWEKQKRSARLDLNLEKFA